MERAQSLESNRSLLSPRPRVGLGLRPVHFRQILKDTPREIDWCEAISENYMNDGPPLQTLDMIRKSYPVVLHGVSLSIGSTDPLNSDYLAKLRELSQRVQPEWISDHLCWTGVHGRNLHDLLPLPYTQETLDHLVPRIQAVQDTLGRRLTLENVSSYLSYRSSEMTEWEFLSELSQRADCDLLLDLNNVYVSSVNHGFDPLIFIDALPLSRVRQFHLAGHTRQATATGELLIDTHDQPVPDSVWDLYAHASRRFGAVPTLIEWDAEIPPLERLMAEVTRAREVQSDALAS